MFEGGRFEVRVGCSEGLCLVLGRLGTGVMWKGRLGCWGAGILHEGMFLVQCSILTWGEMLGGFISAVGSLRSGSKGEGRLGCWGVGVLLQEVGLV